MRKLVFVVPGDINTQTGGYVYDRRLLDGLRAQGRDVQLISLGASYPHPTEADALDAREKLAGLAPDAAVMIDGLALGAMNTSLISSIKAPLVAMIHHPLAHESGLNDESKKLLFETERANLAQASIVIVPSSHIAGILISDYGVPSYKITVAPPGLDLDPVARAPITPPMILSVGIQVRRKGHDLLIRALAEIKDLSWQAVIVGAARDAEYAQELLDLRAELGLEGRIRLAGQVSDQELHSLYSQASIFALATRFEGYGMVFAEAMAFGLPIISSDVGAVAETVPSAAGLLIEPNDANKLSLTLKRLLLEPELRKTLGQGSLSEGLKLGNWDSVATTVGALLDEL